MLFLALYLHCLFAKEDGNKDASMAIFTKIISLRSIKIANRKVIETTNVTDSTKC
ncbi:MAG: hypothetical protein AAFV71_10550 [Cyanobacteria bacterium J06633_8]